MGNGSTRRAQWVFLGLGGAAVLAVAVFFLVKSHGAPRPGQAVGGPPESAAQRAAVRVEVVKPKSGELERTTVQPGTVQAYESVDLYAEVSGFLKTQKVDIGSSINKDEVLAVIGVPELETKVKEAEAAVTYATSRIKLMKAKVKTAEAEYKAAQDMIPQVKAALASAQAMTRFRDKQLSRMKDLFRQNSVDERLVDEKTEQYESAHAAELSASAAVTTAESKLAAAKAQVDQANAEVEDAQAQVEVAQSQLATAQVPVNEFARIKAPFDGVVTRRTLFPGGFVRSAKEGERTPLLSVDRIDKVRVVVQIPDRDVPFANPGDQATILIDALPGRNFTGAIARTQKSEDPLTRTMRVEIDLDNPKNAKGEHLLEPGMYGRVTLVLEKTSNALTIPSGCLIGKSEASEGTVYVVRDGKAQLIPVRLGVDNGLRVEVVSGLKPDDEVVLRYSGSIGDGVPVQVGDIAGKKGH